MSKRIKFLLSWAIGVLLLFFSLFYVNECKSQTALDTTNALWYWEASSFYQATGFWDDQGARNNDGKVHNDRMFKTVHKYGAGAGDTVNVVWTGMNRDTSCFTIPSITPLADMGLLKHTYVIWFRYQDNGNPFLLATNGDNHDNYYFQMTILQNDNNDLRAVMRTGGNDWIWQSTNRAVNNDGKFHQVVMTFDSTGSTKRLFYVDGQLLTGTYTTAVDTSVTFGTQTDAFAFDSTVVGGYMRSTTFQTIQSHIEIYISAFYVDDVKSAAAILSDYNYYNPILNKPSYDAAFYEAKSDSLQTEVNDRRTIRFKKAW